MIELAGKTRAPREALANWIWGGRDTDKIRKVLGKNCGDNAPCYSRDKSKSPCGSCCFAVLVKNGDKKKLPVLCEDCERPCGALAKLEELYFEGVVKI